MKSYHGMDLMGRVFLPKKINIFEAYYGIKKTKTLHPRSLHMFTPFKFKSSPLKNGGWTAAIWNI